MLFNSYPFLLGFLPIVFIGFLCIGRYSHHAACLWLAAASIFFYGWWNLRFVPLLVVSILFNYGMARAIQATKSRALLSIAVVVDLTALGYFKYANFFIDNLNHVVGSQLELAPILLPIGISFFSFTQIAFLMDTWDGKVREYRLDHYFLFVTYFPHLIAGPVLHHRQMMPQFGLPGTYKLRWENIALGATIFAIGLLKKTVVADGIAGYANPGFDAAAHGQPVLLVEAWIAAFAYTMQLYFDFSGYCDMAVGLSRMFNIKLPWNFDSPYKAVSIVEFWRRWHMTLSQFLRDYLYIPLGGNRKGTTRRYVNLMTTMLLGGLWHGAGWTFLIWGTLHGAYLMINHGWQRFKQKVGWDAAPVGPVSRALSVALTFGSVVIAWVFFRAADVRTAVHMLKGMVGLSGISLPVSLSGDPRLAWLTSRGVTFQGLFTNTHAAAGHALLWIALLMMAVWTLPNTQQLTRCFDPGYQPVQGPASLRSLIWRPSWRWAVLTGGALALGLLSLNRVSAFLYFQF
jgi:D-alanyl-lipoteichoic acid acyltransferase DltB (MBOAT superfamily)